VCWIGTVFSLILFAVDFNIHLMPAHMKINELMPLFATILGLTPVFLKWLNDRSTEAAKRRTIQKAKEQIEFWQVWLQAQREVSTDERFEKLKNDVAKRFDQLVLENEDFGTSKSETAKDREQHSFFQRLFLIYFPHTTSGWALHTLFYVTISFMAMFILGSAIPSDDPDSNLSWEHFKGELDLVIPVGLLFGLIAFILMRLANRSEKKYQTRVSEIGKETIPSDNPLIA
jgi:hypothetical protein